uniref:Uncharacterized protein n=1 Tax=Anopheles christyi TaxID=43041 RepID=A0A182KIA5_9DIPT
MAPILKLQLLVAFHRNHTPHVRLNLDYGPHLVAVLSPHQIPPDACLQSYDVPSKMPKPVAKHARSYQRLQPHVADTHLLVPLPLCVSLPVLLNRDRCGSHAQEASAIHPTANRTLQDENFARQDTVTLLLEKQIVRILQEHLRMSQLIVRTSQHGGTDLRRRHPAIGPMGWRYAIDQKPVSFDEIAEIVPYRVTGAPNTNRLHHARVAQLPTAQGPIEQHRLLQLVRFDAPDEERLTLAQRFHERVETFLKLRRQRWRTLARLRTHPNVLRKHELQEFVGRARDQLQQIGTERVAVFLEKPARIIKHHTGKVIQPEARINVRLGLQVVPVRAVRFVQLCQHRLIRTLGEFALLVDQCHNVQLLDRDQIQRVLIVHKLDVLPVDALVIVLLLLELEDVLYEKLLQIFVRKVNAKLLKAVVIEVLEPEDIQHTDGTARRRFRFVDGLIDLLHDQHKQTTVDALHERVPHIHRLVAGQCRHDGFTMREQGFAGERIDERLQRHLEQVCHPLHIDVLRYFGRVQIIDHGRIVLDVSGVEQCGKQLQNFPYLVIGKA